MFERRSAKVVTYQYRINRFELWMLMGLVAVLALQGRKAISRDECFNLITANLRARIKMRTYWYGLQVKGCLVEFKRPQYPNASSWGITPLGWQVCQVFEKEMQRLELAYPKRKRVEPIEVVIKDGDAAPKGYSYAKEPIQRRKEYIEHIDLEDKAKRHRSNN
jgi:hypothetical protein